jgi:hypothetical protein
MKRLHCHPLTKQPAMAQTSSLQIKQAFFNDMMLYSRSLQRSKPWGIVFDPIFGDTDPATDTGDTGDTGGDTGTVF